MSWRARLNRVPTPRRPRRSSRQLVLLSVGFSRLYLNVHWATDVLGGWSAGLLIAVLSAALYDRYRRRSRTVRVGVEPTITSSIS